MQRHESRSTLVGRPYLWLLTAHLPLAPLPRAESRSDRAAVPAQMLRGSYRLLSHSRISATIVLLDTMSAAARFHAASRSIPAGEPGEEPAGSIRRSISRAAAKRHPLPDEPGSARRPEMHRTRTQDRGQTADRDSEQARTRLDRARNQQDVAGVNQTRRTTLVGWDIEQVLRRPHIGVIRTSGMT
jgi:hypothetical protein